MKKHQKYFIKLLNYSKKIKEVQEETESKNIPNRYFQEELKETNNLFKDTLRKIENDEKGIKTDVKFTIITEEEGQKLQETYYIMKEVIKKRKEVLKIL